MQIPLDYYRILGLPIQATPERLQQAYRDRLQQSPRREYSETAIAARIALINEAFETLADDVLRDRYDTKFLNSTLPGASKVGESDDPNPNPPTLEIDDANLVGALPILLELGEYETVLKLGRPLLSQPQSIRDSVSQTLQRADVVLSVATAYLEIGREQWQQKLYEKAAASLEAGQAMLLREGLLPQVRGEMQADLRKLRPYRVLELLSLPLDRDVPRQRGFQLLRDMLQDRGGIDGTGDDQSGLSVEGFLRFIQQLRQHTTVAEQQLLFEMEARRPSAVATYLAAYAAIARGFVQHQPASVYRAKSMLIQLGRRQDVHLEQAICALLLGQSDRATRSLDLSQDDEALQIIRDNSHGSPDLLPGLCLYSEQWLQDDIFPHFRDLKDRTASLKDYFADPQVQTYLENLPPDTQVSDRWLEVGYRQLPPLQPETRSTIPTPPLPTLTATPQAAPALRSSEEPVSWTIDRHGLTDAAKADKPAPVLPRPIAPSEEPVSATAPRKRGRRPPRLRIDRLLLLGAGGVLALFLLLWLVGRVLAGIAGILSNFGAPRLEGTPVSVSLDRPAFTLPEPAPEAETPEDKTRGQLTDDRAQATIKTWLEIKRRAMGKDRDLDALGEILVAPALASLENLAIEAETNGWYWEYEHEVSDVVIETAPEAAPNAGTPPGDAASTATAAPPADRGATPIAIVTATVIERGTLFEGETQVRQTNDTLRVRYELEQRNDRWYVRDWQAEAGN
ncbi:MAG: DUF4101 domain-containing protein [Oscillatoriales cyanobacterium]|nr:MAG: DUF4101 domain-containing protein [Oscillatoriales cyanobacterium]